MKKIIKILLILALITSTAAGYTMYKRMKEQQKTISYTLEGKKYQLLVADTPMEWEKGLMEIRKKNGFDGMIFVFPDYQHRTFWNKNTYVDLDIYWIKDDTVVGKDILPSIEKSKELVRVFSPSEVNKVIEIIK